MPSLTKEARAELLAALRLNAGQADSGNAGPGFYPVAEHLRALEADVVLIVGDRGAGKTQLAHVLRDDAMRDALVRRNPMIRIPSGPVRWITGWPLRSGGPDPLAWGSAARSQAESRDFLFCAWYGYLVRAIGREIDGAFDVPLDAMNVPSTDVASLVQEVRKQSNAITMALDRLNERLEREGRWLFVAYDELDTVVFDDWTALGAVVRGVVSFWAAYARRWSRIRPKVFLRSDFYRHHREVAGADVAKLAANRVEMLWSERSLYGALMKQIVNKDRRLYEHLSSSAAFDEDDFLGYLPRLPRASDARPFVQRLVGEFMGVDSKKGFAFTWLLDHLRDGNGRAVPRSLVWLVEYAAQRELDQPRATGAHLIHHISVRNALDDVSLQYVQQAETNEFQWLVGLGNRLQRDRKVPWTRKELLRLLSLEFEKPWTNAKDGRVRPPGTDSEEVLESMIELGIVRRRPAGLLDVPDLYLAGLKLTRRGGVAKR